MSGAVAAAVPLSRNRDYRLLWSGQALAEVGIGASTIALPLLVLAATGSPAVSGLVLAAQAAAQLLAGAPAGVLVDRWDRRRVLLACEATQAVAVTCLAVAAATGAATVPVLLAVAVVLGCCRALFEPAEAAVLPTLVPRSQLPNALAMNAARGYLGLLVGTAIGGALFAVRRWAPFGLQALAHTVSFGLLLLLRTPPRGPVAPTGIGFRGELVAGLRWVFGDPLIRTVALCAIGLNFVFQAFYLVVLAAAERRGTPAADLGLMAAMLGVGGVLGALSAPRLYRALSPRTAILGVLWLIAVLVPVAAGLSHALALGGLLAGAAFLAPTANTVIVTHQTLRTPDALRGRLAATMTVAVGSAAVLGPAAGGLLAQALDPVAAVLCCAAAATAVAVAATLTPALRRFPAAAHPEKNTNQED